MIVVLTNPAPTLDDPTPILWQLVVSLCVGPSIYPAFSPRYMDPMEEKCVIALVTLVTVSIIAVECVILLRQMGDPT